MNDQNLTLLTAEQALHLGVIEKYGSAAAITDLSILTGGFVYDACFISEDKSLKGRTGYFWTRTKPTNVEGEICCTYKEGIINSVPQYWRCRTIRPVLESPEVFSIVSSYKIKGYNSTEEVEYGEYPQDAVSAKMQKKLDSEYNKGMKKTGRSYTFDAVCNTTYDIGFQPIVYDEYEYKGKKYIRMITNYDECDRFTDELSNGFIYKNGDRVWIEVSPVKWLIDEKTKTLVSKKGLVSGIRFLGKNVKYDDNFNKTDIKQYLDKYMLRDLTQSKTFNPTQFNLLVEKDKIENKQKEIKKAQIEKLILAEQKLKEAAELLNNSVEDLRIDRIKINDLRNLVFKNNGNPTEKGCIEIDDFFKDNMILRMIDLNDLDLTNVDITNMDFSGTNIHIDPQKIYNKDMTGVNALDVHFSPFMDSFDDVILDSAIINDPEAMINFDKLKSYDENTVIEGIENSKATKKV